MTSLLIPAAVCRWRSFDGCTREYFGKHIVQRPLVGEAVAAGVILHSRLLLIGYWSAFDYWQNVVISMVGGLLGVLFTFIASRSNR